MFSRVTTMVDPATCLGCGTGTSKGDLRLLKNFTRVLDVWSSTMMSEFELDETVVKSAIGMCEFMCTKCHKSYTKLIDHYERIKSSLTVVHHQIFQSMPVESVATEDKQSTCSDPGSTATVGLKRSSSNPIPVSLSKRVKSPMFCIQGKGTTSATVVSKTLASHIFTSQTCIICFNRACRYLLAMRRGGSTIL